MPGHAAGNNGQADQQRAGRRHVGSGGHRPAGRAGPATEQRDGQQQDRQRSGGAQRDVFAEHHPAQHGAGDEQGAVSGGNDDGQADDAVGPLRRRWLLSGWRAPPPPTGPTCGSWAAQFCRAWPAATGLARSPLRRRIPCSRWPRRDRNAGRTLSACRCWTPCSRLRKRRNRASPGPPGPAPDPHVTGDWRHSHI